MPEALLLADFLEKEMPTEAGTIPVNTVETIYPEEMFLSQHTVTDITGELIARD